MSDCKHEFLEIENNDLFLQCTKCGVWIEINEYPLHEAEQRIKDLETQLAEATSKLSKIECVCDVYKDMQSEYETGTEIPYWDIMNIIKDY